MSATIAPGGDPDVARVAALFAEPTRARILMALGDGRSLPASMLAAEANVTPQAASAQLTRLRAGGLLTVEQSGRHRYYRLASAHVATVLEALAQLAPKQPIRSLRQSTRAAALRSARTCYDHLAGQLGVQITQALIDRDVLTPTDGIPDTQRRPDDQLSGRLPGHPYTLGTAAVPVLTSLGVPPDRLTADAARRPLLRFCLDWTEQRHHLAGRLGADLLAAFTTAGWVTRTPRQRTVRLTPAGEQAITNHLGLDPGTGRADAARSGSGRRP
jgi:DNA-binding transcriptional ArsR family regulator